MLTLSREQVAEIRAKHDSGEFVDFEAIARGSYGRGRAHAKLSASGAHRWMECPASVAEEERAKQLSDMALLVHLEKYFAESDATEIRIEQPDVSPFAAEGTRAHELAEYCLRNGCAASATDEFDTEMRDAVQVYLDYVNSIPGDLFIERRVDFSKWVPEGFGTADAIVLDGGVAHVVDLKYGKGIRVEAEHNPQAMLYALGACTEFGFLEDVCTVKIAIVQPRLDHISEWTISTVDLLEWADKKLHPAALATDEDRPQAVPGDKQCRFCAAKSVCSALVEHCTSEAVLGFDPVDESASQPDAVGLSHENISLLLGRFPLIRNWISAVEAHAHDLLSRGENLPGYKLVEGRSIRKWVDETAAVAGLLGAGLGEESIYTQSIISPSQAEKKLGKDGKDVVEPLANKPPGKPTMVPEADKRPAIPVAPLQGFGVVQTANCKLKDETC